MKKYIVDLTEDERSRLLDLISKGKPAARKVKRANILLLADQDITDQEIAEMLHSSIPTIERTRKKFVLGNLDNALNEKSRAGRPCKLDAQGEAYLIALACSKPPVGRVCWTTQLLADRLVELNMVDDISDETLRLRLKKVRSSRGNASSGVSPNWIPSSFGAWKTS